MGIPELYVDFNEMLEPDLVLLSAADSKVAVTGEQISLRAGLQVAIYMDDFGVITEDDQPAIQDVSATESWVVNARTTLYIPATMPVIHLIAGALLF